MASKGYVIIAPNRRGAPGFGQDWVDAISKDWGGGAMQDILAATDDLCKENYIKKDGLSAIGGSAGGFTTFWLEGNHNKRFKAFVSHCGVFDLESMYGSTEELWFTNWDYAGPYWDKTAKLNYDRFSPHVFADKWDTPILITTGEKDFRVPYTQSLEAFTVAQVKGIPSELIVYPEENHFILHPQEQILWYRQMFNFLDKYCK
jgi:dipeptidyl aminopeptidase/acylaminoacyl peptidase